MKRRLRIVWRGWNTSPLFVTRHMTAFFTDGIAYGVVHSVASKQLYFGHWIISIKLPYDRDFIDKVANRTRPKNSVTVVKPATSNKYGIWDYMRRNEQ